MKNPILSVLVMVLFISTSAFGQRDQRVIKSRNGETRKLVKRTNRKGRTVKVVNRNRRTARVSNRYAAHPRVTRVSRQRNWRHVRHLPQNYRRINYGGVGYYYNGGRFYLHNNGYYDLVAAPIGCRFRNLPVGCTRVVRGSRVYFVNAGTYYSYNNSCGYYEVVQAPDGLILYELPYGTEVVMVNDLVYYEYGGVFYKKVETQYGEGYKVAGELLS